jgi:hypothetical protein
VQYRALKRRVDGGHLPAVAVDAHRSDSSLTGRRRRCDALCEPLLAGLTGPVPIAILVIQYHNTGLRG